MKDSVLTGTADSPGTPTTEAAPTETPAGATGPTETPAGAAGPTEMPADAGGPTEAPARAARGVDAVTEAVAGHVRALRQARGWSLDELAGRSGVSKGMVVQIEAGRTNPSIGILCRIADAFGVTVARLLETGPSRPVRVSDAGSAPMLWRGDRGGFARLLVGRSEPEFVELWEWRLQPGDAHDSADHTPGTRELVHVLDGELIVTVQGADHRVRAGETIDFLADKAHGYRNGGGSPVRLLMVVIMPSGEYDRRR